ncbi:MAG: tandem-95 repeat protein [Thermoplasmata archaeon]
MKPSGMWTEALAVGVCVLMLLGSASALTPEGGGTERAADTEPNGEQSQAVPITSGETVQGSLLITSQWDTSDYYRIDVPYGKAVQASLYMVDYDTSDPGRYNFHLRFYNNQSQYSFDRSETYNRWERLGAIQYWYAGGSAVVYIRVIVNQTGQGWTRTEPGRYNLSVFVDDPIDYTGGLVNGTLDASSERGIDFYKLGIFPQHNQQMRVSVQSPVNGKCALEVFQIWPVNGGWYRLNGSWRDVAGANQEVFISGTGSETFYAKVRMVAGSGTYKLSAVVVGSAPDNDNIPENANVINDNSPHEHFLDQGTDWLDWFRVNARAGKTIKEVYIVFSAGNFRDNSNFYLTARDKDLRYINETSIPRQQGYNWYDYASLTDITVNYDGPVYFVVRALSYSGNMTTDFIGAQGWYKLTFTLPNDPPRLNGTIPEIQMLEDTSNSDLMLSNYFMDPDGDNLTYSLFGSGYKTRPVVDRVTGKVTFTPEKNWYGRETVKFQVKDSGPGNLICYGTTNVTVLPVNDQPYLSTPQPDIVIQEHAVGYTSNLATLFLDEDDPPSNFTYTCTVLSSETHPANMSLPMVYEKASNWYKFGPAEFFYGSFLLELTCTDGHEGTVPASTRFYVNITHVNHPPVVKPTIPDPYTVILHEGGRDDQTNVADLFTDPDIMEDYSDDALTYCITGQKKVTVSIARDGRIIFDAGSEEYVPGSPYEERLIMTAKDRAGLRATLNITVRVEPEDDPPYFTKVTPEDTNIEMSENQKKTFSVAASDIDTPELSYSWYLDGAKDKTARGFTYIFATDYNMGGRTYALRVDVTDGHTTISFEWNITVIEVNRPPTAYIKTPTNMSSFKKGAYISFSAEGSDEDGDNLTFVWRDQTGAELGRGPSFSTNRLPKGTQTVTLEVSDGKSSVIQTVTIVVKDAGKTSGGGAPGFEGLALIGVMGISLLLWRRRKHLPAAVG